MHRLISFLPTLLLSVLLAAPAQAEILTGKVVRILDGDTIEVLQGKTTHRVRFAGIDAPESNQPFGTKAKRALSAVVGGESVRVDWHKRDRYDRLVGKVTLDGADVNLSLVENGLAWWYREYSGEQSARDRHLYEAAERRARQARRGLWADPDPVAPWDWRDGKRTSSAPRTGECPCDSGRRCTGPRGGIYCTRENGSKSYFPRD